MIPTTSRANGNGPNEPCQPQGRTGKGPTQPKDPKDAREWTERTLRCPGRMEMGLTRANEPDYPQGARQFTERTRTNTPTPPTVDGRTHPTAHESGPNVPEPKRRCSRRTGMEITHPTPTRLHGNRTLSRQGRTGMDRTNPRIPRRYGNGLNVSKRTRRATGRTGMDRKDTYEPEDTQRAREWT